MSEPTAQESMDQHLKEARAALEAMAAERDKWKRQWSEDFEVRTHLLAERDAAITKADKLQAEVDAAKEKYTAEERLRWQNVSADFKRALEEKARLTAELDAVRKELEQWRRSDIAAREMPIGSVMAYIHGRMVVASADGRNTTNTNDLLLFTEQQYWAVDEFGNFPMRLAKAQARCADLERAIQEAPHSDKCHFAYHPNGWICDCWKSRISPDQKPALKGGDAGMFTKAPPMKGAADVQSESRPASPDHGKAGEFDGIELGSATIDLDTGEIIPPTDAPCTSCGKPRSVLRKSLSDHLCNACRAQESE